MDDVRATISHDEIQNWSEKNSGRPQSLDSKQAQADIPGIRIDFPGNLDDTFLPMAEVYNISWNDFFRTFEDEKLAFLYIDPDKKLNSDQLSRAYRFIKRDILDKQEEDPEQLISLIDDFLKYYNGLQP